MECSYDLIEGRLFPASNGTGAEAHIICLEGIVAEPFQEQGIRNWKRVLTGAGYACACSATTQLPSFDIVTA
jgi:hypothetical protein